MSTTATPPAGPPPLRRRRLAAVAAAVVGSLAVLSACIPTGTGTELISAPAGDRLFDRQTYGTDLSRDGRFVIFSAATATPVPNDHIELFRRDRATDEVVPVNVTDSGQAMLGRNIEGSVSADGTRVAFNHSTRGTVGFVPHVYLRDLRAGRTLNISVNANGVPTRGSRPRISSDGNHVAFVSDSTAIVPGDTNGRPDVFVRDLAEGSTRRVSLSHAGNQISVGADSTAISADGRYVAFRTTANLTVDDTDSDADVYVRDTVGGTTSLVSIAGNDTEALLNFDISDDGRYVSFLSRPRTGGHPQAWVRDRSTAQLHLVTRDVAGAPSNGPANWTALSRDGQHVAVATKASNLPPGENDNSSDVYVAKVDGSDLTRFSLGDTGQLPNAHSFEPAVADGGETVAFLSNASNLVVDDADGFATDVFVRRR